MNKVLAATGGYDLLTPRLGNGACTGDNRTGELFSYVVLEVRVRSSAVNAPSMIAVGFLPNSKRNGQRSHLGD